MNDFPSSPEALSRDWLSDALRTTVRDFRVERLGEGAGVIGQVTRVHLDADGAPASIIAKFPSPAPENRAVAATYDMYGREVRFYQDIAHRLPLRTPACYFATHDADSQDFVLLLEDLVDLRIGDQVAGCSVEEARAVVDALAAMHAATWEAKDLNLISHSNPAQRDGMRAGFQMGWPVVLDRFADLIPQRAKVAGSAMPDAVGELLEMMCADPVCMTHADVRLDNIFFDDAGGIVLVDWQAVCTSAPEQDLAYFVTQSLPVDVRNGEDFVARYHAALTGHGIDYDLSRCRARFRVSALYLLCFAVVIAGTLDMGNERGERLARTLLGNALTALDEMDAFALLE